MKEKIRERSNRGRRERRGGGNEEWRKQDGDLRGREKRRNGEEEMLVEEAGKEGRVGRGRPERWREKKEELRWERARRCSWRRLGRRQG